MKVLIAIGIAIFSVTASATPFCLGRSQVPYVPNHLNIPFDVKPDPANSAQLVLQSLRNPEDKWVFAPTNDMFTKRRANNHCIKLVEDHQRETFRLAMQNRSESDRLGAILLLSIGMGMGMNVTSGNLCHMLEQAQAFYLVDNPENPQGKALIGNHILVSKTDSGMVIMEGSLGFVYFARACVQPRLK